ncbi:MAG: SDR family NAD(P)-dependent oxidoreductase, partial [Pseudomonadota bacterium]
MTETNDQTRPAHLDRRALLAGLAAAPLSFGVFASAAPGKAEAQTGLTRVALITGASSGFGYVTARTLALSGFQVIATMRNVSTSNASAAR